VRVAGFDRRQDLRDVGHTDRVYQLFAVELFENKGHPALPPPGGYRQLNDVSFLAARSIVLRAGDSLAPVPGASSTAAGSSAAPLLKGKVGFLQQVRDALHRDGRPLGSRLGPGQAGDSA
jgi:hypothetical protein